MHKLLQFLALTLLAAPIAAHADQFTVTISVGGNQVANLIITGETPASGGFTATSISGTDGVLPVTLLAPGSYFGNDNFFSIASPYFDLNGLGFTTGGPKGDYDIYTYDSKFYYCSDSEVCDQGDGAVATVSISSTTVAPSATPEPSSLILLGTGLVAMGGTVRRRFA